MAQKLCTIVILFLAVNIEIFSQVYNNYDFDFFFFNREVSAAMEATGRINLPFWNNASTSLSNPSYSSSANYYGGLFSYTGNIYGIENLSQSFYGVNIPIKNIGNFTVSRKLFNWNGEIMRTTVENPYGTGETFSPELNNYNISYSTKLNSNLSLGIGFNFIHDEFTVPIRDFYSLNIGFNYLYKLSGSKLFTHKLIFGAGFQNILFYCSNNTYESGYPEQTYEINLPQISNFTAGYSITSNTFGFAQDLDDLSATFGIEYMDILNSSIGKAVKFGSELSFIEFIKLRFGFYSYDFNSATNEFTYGFGLNVPLNKLTKLPLNFAIDYVQMTQPYITAPSNKKGFEYFTIRLDYLIE